jgi:hypothetical protein
MIIAVLWRVATVAAQKSAELWGNQAFLVPVTPMGITWHIQESSGTSPKEQKGDAVSWEATVVFLPPLWQLQKNNVRKVTNDQGYQTDWGELPLFDGELSW